MQETESAVGNARLRLPTQLGVDSVAALKISLQTLLARPDKVVLEADEVERVHTAALQLFCLFCRDRRAEGREVEFARPSVALRNAAELLGTSSLLQLAGGTA